MYISLLLMFGCFQWFKDTNLKVNHNASLCLHQIVYAVYDGVDNN